MKPVSVKSSSVNPATVRKLCNPRIHSITWFFNSCVYSTFREACAAQGFLQSVSLFAEIFTEGSQTLYSLTKVCELFAGITVHNEIANCEPLYDEVSDILYGEAMREYPTFNEEEIMQVTLYHLEKAFEQIDRISSNYGLNQCTNEVIRHILEEDVDYDINLYGQIPTTLNETQQTFFNRVVSGEHQLYFLDGPAGTGKTFLLKGLLAFYHRQMKKVMVIASSGIAAIMYPTGETAHKGLNIPIHFDDATILKIPEKSKLYKDLKELSLLVFDEISMISKQILDLIDKSFRILFQCPAPFAGKRIVLLEIFDKYCQLYGMDLKLKLLVQL